MSWSLELNEKVKAQVCVCVLRNICYSILYHIYIIYNIRYNTIYIYSSYINTSCCVCIMLLVGTFSELTIWYWICLGALFPGEVYFSCFQYSLIACNSLSMVEVVESIAIVFIQLMFRQLMRNYGCSF